MSCPTTYLLELAISTSGSLIAAVLWAKRHWIARELEKINWKRSGNMWWLACDLHSIKLLADLNYTTKEPDYLRKMRIAMDNSFGHAQALHMDEQVLSGIRKLKSTFYSKEPLTAGDKTEIREQVDAIIDYCGRLAIKNQPDFKP
jgi:hypothetical protein